MVFRDGAIPEFPQSGPRNILPLFNPGSLVTIYTALQILLAIRRHLGLEAMLEYMTKYSELVEKNNPRLKSAVTQALAVMSVEKIYGDAIREEIK